MKHDLRVTAAAQRWGIESELIPDFSVVVYFAVERQKGHAIRARHRLVRRAAPVQDRESAMTECGRAHLHKAHVIRAPSGQWLEHAPHGFAVIAFALESQDAGDAAHGAYPLSRGDAVMRPVGTDVCVPVSRLAECIAATNADIARASMPIALFGHVGDGNFHLVMMVDQDSPAEIAEAKEINRRVVLRGLAMGGTCTGEHGIGCGKLDYLEAEHGDAVEIMRSLKRALDPTNILNPGKVLRM